MANVMKFYGFEFSSASSASPELSGAQSCFKSTLVVANIIFLIFGAVLCGVGGYAMQTKAGGLAGESLPSGIIVMGVFIMLVSFLGCVAANRESRCLLGVYFGFLLLFVIILLAVGIAVYAMKDQAEKLMVEGWCAAQEPASRTPQQNVPVIHDIQNYFQCCGLYKFNDSQTHYITQNDGGGTPITTRVTAACALTTSSWMEPANSVGCPANLNIQNGIPCLDQLKSTFQSSYVAAGASAIAFGVIMAAGMIFVCVLMSGIKEKQHLEEIRKLHRKLREAKEDPAHAGLRGLAAGGVAGGVVASEFGDVDLNAQDPLDTEVHINVDPSLREEGETHGEAGSAEDVGGNLEEEQAVASFTPGQSSFKAQPPTKIKKSKKKSKPAPPPQPTYDEDEQPYEEEPQQHSRYAPQADEYDEEN